MEKIIEIIMKRDNMSYEDARSLVQQIADEIMCNPMDAPEILADNLMLEPDYLPELFNY